MPNIKISNLPAAGTIDPATDVLPIVSGGATEKATPDEIVTAALNATPVTVEQGGTGLAYIGDGILQVQDNVISSTPTIDTNQITGLASMAFQSGFDVNITGGTISGVTITDVSAEKLAGGNANQIPFQTAPSQTGFIEAPPAADTFLHWNGTAFNWSVGTSSGVTEIIAGDNIAVDQSTGSVTVSVTGTVPEADHATSADSATAADNATTADGLNTDAALATPASGDFSTGTFTWPTFNQNTTGTAAAADYAGVATNLNAGVAGDIPVQTGAATTEFINVGTEGQVLKVVAGTPAWATDATTAPAGNNTEIQYNNNGAFGASTNLTFDGSFVSQSGNVVLDVSDKAVAGGLATLDMSGTIPMDQIPASLIGAVEYQGAWNATTNTPTLTSSVGTKGHYYVVSVAGTTDLNGITDWSVNDWAIFNGSVWQAVYNTNGVLSVNGQTGVVTLTNTDISGFGTMSTQNANNVNITGGTISGITDLAVADGGTGASSLTGYLKGTGTTPFQASATIPGSDISGAVSQATNADNVPYSGLTGTVPTWNQDTTGNAATATTATNVASGAANQIVYQTAAGTTGFISAGTKGQIMVAGNGGVPAFSAPLTWNQDTTGNAGGLSNGVAGSIPYQEDTSLTTFLDPSTDGKVLTLVNGLPAWETNTSPIITEYANVYWVQAGTGSDSNSGTSITEPFATISAALTAAGSNPATIQIAPGTYSANLSISNTNIDFIGMTTRSGLVTIAGTVGTSNATGSVRFQGINFGDDVTFASAGNVSLYNCFASSGVFVNHTGTGNLGTSGTDFSQVAGFGVSVGTCNWFGGALSNPTVTGGSLNINSSTNVKTLAASGGSLTVTGCNTFSTSSGAAPIDISGTAFVLVENTSLQDSTGALAPITIGASATYAFNNASFDYLNSTISGTNASPIEAVFDDMVVEATPILGFQSGVAQIGPDPTSSQSQASVNNNTKYNWTGEMSLAGGPFYEVLNANNINSYAPLNDGTGATGTWGIDISGNAATATTAGSATAAGTLYYREYWVDPTNGSDTTGSGRSPISPYATVGKALSVISNGSGVINMALGNYAENLTITAQNVDFVGMASSSGVVHISGNWNFAPAASSLRCSQLAFYGQLNVTGAGAVYFDNCETSSTASIAISSGAGYVEIHNSDFSSGTGATIANGLTAINDSKFMASTISNSAVVSFNGCQNVKPIAATNSTVVVINSVVYATSAGVAPIVFGSGAVLSLFGAQLYDTNGSTPAKIDGTGAVAFNSISSVFAKVTSTLPGSLGVPAYTDIVGTGVFTVAALPSAAAVGKGARAFVSNATATTFASTVVGGGSNNVPVYSDGTNWKIG